MKRIPISLILVGLLFTLLNIQVAGQDIFIDAVGYLVAWNGLRVLDKTYKKTFLCAAPFSFILVLICIAQLFLKGSLYRITIDVRIVVEMLFYVQLYYGLFKLGQVDKIKNIKIISLVSIILCEISLIIKLIYAIILPTSGFLYTANEFVYYVLIIVVSGSLLWLRHTFTDEIVGNKAS